MTGLDLLAVGPLIQVYGNLGFKEEARTTNVMFGSRS